MRWLAEWQLAEPVPVPAEAVATAIAEHEASLIPADIRAVAIELDRLCDTHGTPADWERRVDDYLEAFEDVPLDLIKKACKHGRLEIKFFPKPAELRAAIKADLNERRDALRRLRTAAMKAKPAKHQPEPTRERTPEQLAAAAAAKEQACQALSAGPARAMPRSSDDLRQQNDDSYAAARRRVATGLAGFKRIKRSSQPWGAAEAAR